MAEGGGEAMEVASGEEAASQRLEGGERSVRSRRGGSRALGKWSGLCV